ncbi:Torso-like protein, partial [Caligus rogercresseyi]
PREDPGSWLIREPTNSILAPGSYSVSQEFRNGNFEPYYQVYLCDDTNELKEAFFKDFKVIKDKSKL